MKFIPMAAVAAAVFAAASAHATTYIENNVTGTVAGFTPISGFQPGTPSYDYTGLYETLSGFTPITVAAGDVIDVTVTLDKALTIPASTSWTGLILGLTGGAGGGGQDNFVWTFYDGATALFTLTTLSTTNGDVSSFASLNPPNNGVYTITSFTDDITVTTLNTASVDLTGALFEEFQATNVPEPAAWSLMLAGIGGLGALLRRRRPGLAATA